jgi:hypothetical protein
MSAVNPFGRFGDVFPRAWDAVGRFQNANPSVKWALGRFSRTFHPLPHARFVAQVQFPSLQPPPDRGSDF